MVPVVVMATVTTDYTGRFVDLFTMQGAQVSGMRQIATGWGADYGGAVITGIQKAAQTFLTLFLTEKGSREHDPDFGSRFVTRVRLSNMINNQVLLAFREAAEAVLEQQERYRETKDSDDEVLSEIELVSFASPDPTQLSLVIQIQTLAGETREITVPVTLAIR
jgi:phage baseplate assembly protein W